MLLLPIWNWTNVTLVCYLFNYFVVTSNDLIFFSMLLNLMRNKVFLFEIANLIIQFEYYVCRLSPCKYGILISLSVHRFLKYNLLAHTYILHSEKKKSNMDK